MKKNQFVLKKMKQVATCALAVAIVATSTSSEIAYASQVNDTVDSKDLVVEEKEDTTKNIEVITEEENTLIENEASALEEVVPNSLESVQTQLEAGTYLVPVAMMNASNISNPSMASSTLESIGLIIVSEDGTVTLQTKWKSLSMAGLVGSVTKIGVFQTEDISSQDAIDGLVEATVDTYRKVSYSEELKPEKITLTIPNDMKTKNGVYIKMEVDMGMNPEAFIKIDYANANAVTLSLDQESLSLKVGESSSITASIPDNAIDEAATFSSSDETVATVEEDGTVHAVAEGTATITATANGLSKTCIVTVTQASMSGFGSKATEFSKGSYFVNVELKNANNISMASSAAKALELVGTLEVEEDGSATLTTKWVPISFGSISASIQTLEVYETTKAPQAEDTSNAIAVDSNGYASFAIPSAVKNQDGIYVRVSGQGMPIKPYAFIAIDYEGASDISFVEQSYTVVKGVDKVFKVDLLNNTTATFATTGSELNIKSSDSNSVTVTGVRAGTSTISATSLASGKKVSIVVTVVDKDALNHAITSAKSILEDANNIYTSASKENLSAAIKAAEAVKNKEESTQAEIDAQVLALSTARNNLVKNTVLTVNKSALKDMLTSAKAINNANGMYLTASFTNLKNAIEAAQIVYNNENATQSEVDTKVLELKNAIDALQKSSISLNQTEATIYTKNGTTTVTFVATVVGDNQNVTWTSSNQAIAKVDNKGVVTAVSEGSVTITASANGVSANAQVTVKAPSLTLAKTSGVVAVGGKITIEANSDPSSKITYKTSNKKVATVNEKGVVRGVKKGSAKITVTANGISKTFKVTVKKQTLKLKKSSATVTAGKTIAIKATASPTGNITYKSSNKKVATVSSKGVVKGIKAGKATITVKCNGVSKTFKVTVKKQTLTLKKTSATIKVGKTVKINATASPKGSITYKSNQESIATVTSKGVVKGVKKGTAKITVTCNGVSKTFKVKVK